MSPCFSEAALGIGTEQGVWHFVSNLIAFAKNALALFLKHSVLVSLFSGSNTFLSAAAQEAGPLTPRLLLSSGIYGFSWPWV